jgi:transposase
MSFSWPSVITPLASDTIIERIDEVSGIGPLSASAFVAAVGTPERFKSGRVLSAWLGMTPKEYSSGNSRKLGKISRAGNVYVRTMLIHCARSALLSAKRCAANTPEKLTHLQLTLLRR